MSTDDPVRDDDGVADHDHATHEDGKPAEFAKELTELLPVLGRKPRLALEMAEMALGRPLVPRFDQPTWFKASGQARVCRARDAFLEREVAVKLVGGGDDRGFEREARVTAQLNHEHIVPLHYFGLVEVEGEVRPELALVTKLIGRRTLEDAIGEGAYRRDRNELRASVQLIAQVAEALQHAHENEVLHRDIKPGNIFLEERGKTIVPKLGDFGITKAIPRVAADGQGAPSPLASAGAAVTVEGGFTGTEEYAAPEQQWGRRVDERTDLFSLGMVLYEVLTGQRAFSPQQLKSEQPLGAVPPSRLRREVDPRLDEICAKALAWDPAARHQSAAMLAADLWAWLKDLPLPTFKTGLATRTWLYFRRSPARASLMGALVLIGALSTVLVVNGWLHAKQRRHDDCARSLALAEREESIGKMADAESRLDDSCRDEGLRGWEWSYLRRHAGDDPRVLRGRQGLLFATAFNPANDRMLVTAGLDGLVTFWDPVLGRPLRAPLLADVPAAGRTPLRAAAFSPDGRTFAAAGGGPRQGGPWPLEPGAPLGEILIWDVADWTLRRRIPIDQNAWSLTFSPNGETIVTGCGLLDRKSEGSVQMHDVATGALLRRIPMRTRSFAVTYDPSGTVIAAGGEDSRVHLLDAASGRPLAQLVASDRPGRIVRGLAFSRDGQRLAAGAGAASTGDTGDLRVWRAPAWERELSADGVGDHDGHVDEVGAVAFSPDGERLASGGFDRTVRIWDIAARRETLTLRQHTDIVRGVAFSPRGDLLASVGEDGVAVIWDARPPEHNGRPFAPSHRGRVQRVAFAAVNGGLVAVSGEDRDPLHSEGGRSSTSAVKILSAAGGPVIRSLRGQTDMIGGIALSEDGRWLASGSYDGTVLVWNLASDEGPLSFGEKKPSWLNGVAFDRGAHRLAIARNYAVEVWDVRSQRRSVLGKHEWLVSGLAFHPDGGILASGSWDQTARLWDLRRTGSFTPLEGHHGRINAIVFSPDGRIVATASNDATVKTWSLDGVGLATFVGHEDAVLDVAFSPDGHWLASAGQDQTVRIWEVERGLLKEVIRRYAARVRAVTFGRSSRELIVAVGDERGGGFETVALAER